jgi:hypothetical protein
MEDKNQIFKNFLIDQIVGTTIKNSDAAGVNELINQFNKNTPGNSFIGHVVGGRQGSNSFVNNSIGTIAAFAYSNPKMFSSALLAFAPPMAPFIPFINMSISAAKTLGVQPQDIKGIVSNIMNKISVAKNPDDLYKYIETELVKIIPPNVLNEFKKSIGPEGKVELTPNGIIIGQKPKPNKAVDALKKTGSKFVVI